VKIRHLSPAGVIVVAAVVLSACTATTPSPEFDHAAAAQDYVELLRGENDLAHGSLDVPSPSTLPAFAAVSSALRYAGEPVSEVSREALEELTRRSGEDAAWAVYYLCEATGGDTLRVAELVPDWPEPAATGSTIDSINAASDRIITERARECLGLPTLLGDSDWTSLARYSTGNALVSVQLAALARLLGHPLPTDLLSAADISTIETAIESDGCSDWVHANSAAARSLVPELVAAAPAVDSCASDDAVTITDPTTLLYLVAAEARPAHLATVLEANSRVVERALQVDGSVATTGSTPTGNGTIASSRDAVLFLRLSGSSRVPAWIGEGVVSALQPDDGAALGASDAVDALYVCAALELECPPDFLTRAHRVALGLIADAANAGAGDGSAAARAVEAAREAQIDLAPACTLERARLWLDGAPQLLAAFAVSEKECVELLALDDDTLTPLVAGAIDDLRLEDALAYCLLRLLANDASPHESTFTTTARDGFDALWRRLDEENGDGYLATARPLRIELAQAKENQWLD
jgi:hypothetical protein